jgi:hypothetical protein
LKKFRIVIPSWAPLSIEMQAETGCIYPAFIQLSGIPMYAHIIHYYSQICAECEFTVVLAPDSPNLRSNFVNNKKVEVLRLENSLSIGETVMAGLRDIAPHQPIVIHMADTLVSLPGAGVVTDTLYVTRRRDLYRWTTIERNYTGSVRVIHDRDETVTARDKFVCVGVFAISDGLKFADHLRNSINTPKASLDPFFSAIEAYSDERSFNFVTPLTWYDCGHVDSYYESRLSHHNLRYFNSLTYDAVRGIVTKRSQNTDAFRHQVRWYKQVPDELSSFLPRVFDSSDGDDPYITMELLSNPTLGELLVNKQLELGAWNEVARKILWIQSILSKYSSESNLSSRLTEAVYVTKTQIRIKQFCKQFPKACHLKVGESGKIIDLHAVARTLPEFVKKNNLLELQKLSPIHGDLCFSNIMYDPRSRHVKLIDPRGEFGIPGIYGDPRYDKAKLLHSYSGCYDLIIADQFEIRENNCGFLECIIMKDSYHRKIMEIFDAELFADADERQQCEAIQALLFLGMLPYHSDKPARQLAMLHTGLQGYSRFL